MNLQVFTKLLSKHLYPQLRNEGFRGSGATLRRVNGLLVHVFNVQGGSGGQRCYLNLGTHLAFLSGDGGSDWQPNKVLEYQCAFRSRIDPPAEQEFGWSYGSSETEAEANALAVVEAWETQGLPFFAKYSTFPEDFARLVDEVSPEQSHPSTCLTAARIASHLGNPRRAAAIAASALERVSAQATGLRHSLRQLIAAASAP
jgi:hypothetical protein